MNAINWAQCHTRPILMIPGPTELPFPVIQALNQPPTIQYDKSFDEGVLEPTTLALREVFQTKNEVILMPGSGRTALEAGALSVIEPGDRVLVIGAGQFGILMREIMKRVGADFTEFPVELGAQLDLPRLTAEAERLRPKAITLVHNETSTGTTYPSAEVGKIARAVGALFLLDTVSSIAGIDVRTDEWGVDLNMTGSQKCLAAPLGMGLVAVGPRAWAAMEARKEKPKSLVYDLLRWKELWIPKSRGGAVADGAGRRQPVSIPTHLTFAMQAAVRLILDEGLPARFRRHEVAAGALRAGLMAMGLEMFPDQTLWSNTVSSEKTPKDVDPAAVVSRMREQYGILIGTGLDRLRASTLRIGTMALTASPHYIL
ncbi:MAG: alanine--glyoxylate aminotransferase family protein, partial [Candidatus Rokubacteria bacterium]|nr:alanine--glyoxylate aminotransferase family protein [Candidatus Rokubacteria bacterium]